MPSNKSPGIDKVNIKVIKDCLSIVSEPLTGIICERIVFNQLSDYLEKYNRLTSPQSGNRYKHSTESVHLLVTDHILKAIDEKKVTVLVLLDLSKAFDSIDHDHLLQPVQNAKDLGSIMDSNLPFDEHIKQSVSSCMKKLHQINRIKNLFTGSTLEMIIQSQVFSKLFYCSTVWSSTSLKNISQLQTVQNFAARIMTGSCKYDYVTPVLRRLKWLPEDKILYFQDCV